MDGARFDTITRTLTAAGSRRRALAALGGALALLLGLTETEAHNKLKKCKRIKDNDKKRTCLKKARKHNAAHRTLPPTGCPDNRPPCGGFCCSSTKVCLTGNVCGCAAGTIQCSQGFCASETCPEGGNRDQLSCACGTTCPDGRPLCGGATGVCCNPARECIDPTFGVCTCPNGLSPCSDSCASFTCPDGSDRDGSTCRCPV